MIPTPRLTRTAIALLALLASCHKSSTSSAPAAVLPSINGEWEGFWHSWFTSTPGGTVRATMRATGITLVVAMDLTNSAILDPISLVGRVAAHGGFEAAGTSSSGVDLEVLGSLVDDRITGTYGFGPDRGEFTLTRAIE